METQAALMLSFADPPLILVDHVVNIRTSSHECTVLLPAACVYTGQYMQAAAEECVPLSAAEYFPAPFAVVQLGETLQDFIQKKPDDAGQNDGHGKDGLTFGGVFVGKITHA